MKLTHLASLEMVTQEECEKNSAVESRTLIANNVQNTINATLIVTIYHNLLKVTVPYIILVLLCPRV